jgi:hypothetical protein
MRLKEQEEKNLYAYVEILLAIQTSFIQQMVSRQKSYTLNYVLCGDV